MTREEMFLLKSMVNAREVRFKGGTEYARAIEVVLAERARLMEVLESIMAIVRPFAVPDWKCYTEQMDADLEAAAMVLAKARGDQ